MKTFCIKVVLFLTILVGFLISLEVILSWHISSRASFRLESQPNMVVFGDSYPQCSFNDSIIHHFSNLSYSADFYYFIFHKFKYVIDQNPEIVTVFIGVSRYQVIEDLDDWLWEDKYLTRRQGYPLYAPLMGVDDKLKLLFKNPSGWLQANSISLKENLKRILKQDYDFIDEIGSYRYHHDHENFTNLELLDSDKKNACDVLIKENLLYLDQMLTLCKAKNKQAYFVRTPINPDYTYCDHRIEELLSSNYPEIEVLDFRHILTSDHHFRDLEHLNSSGADLFSFFFQQLIEDGLLDQEDKQAFIERQFLRFFPSNL